MLWIKESTTPLAASFLRVSSAQNRVRASESNCTISDFCLFGVVCRCHERIHRLTHSHTDTHTHTERDQPFRRKLRTMPKTAYLVLSVPSLVVMAMIPKNVSSTNAAWLGSTSTRTSNQIKSHNIKSNHITHTHTHTPDSTKWTKIVAETKATSSDDELSNPVSVNMNECFKIATCSLAVESNTQTHTHTDIDKDTYMNALASHCTFPLALTHTHTGEDHSRVSHKCNRVRKAAYCTLGWSFDTSLAIASSAPASTSCSRVSSVGEHPRTQRHKAASRKVKTDIYHSRAHSKHKQRQTNTNKRAPAFSGFANAQMAFAAANWICWSSGVV